MNRAYPSFTFFSFFRYLAVTSLAFTPPQNHSRHAQEFEGGNPVSEGGPFGSFALKRALPRISLGRSIHAKSSSFSARSQLLAGTERTCLCALGKSFLSARPSLLCKRLLPRGIPV